MSWMWHCRTPLLKEENTVATEQIEPSEYAINGKRNWWQARAAGS